MKKFSLTWKDAGISIGILSLTTAVCWWFDQLGFTDATLITVYILAVLLISFLTSSYVIGGGSALLSVLIFNYLFTVPFFSLRSYGTGYPVTLVVMFLSAFLTSSLTAQIKRQAQQHAQNAYRTEMLLGANRRLQLARNEQEILEATAKQIQKLLLRSVILYPVQGRQLADPILVPAGESITQLKNQVDRKEERETAEWVMTHNTQGGATTKHSANASFWYLAIRMNESDVICSVVGIKMKNQEVIDASDRNLLLAMLGECAVMVEKERLNRASEEYAFQIKQEQLRSNLLRSISHDLRTPLTTISGNANLLMNHIVVNEEDKKQLYTDIYEDAVWLTDLVENLLSITRIDNEKLRLSVQPQDLADLLDAAVTHMQTRLKKHRIILEPIEDLIILNVESGLFVQLLDNLIENAFKYGGVNSTVTISAHKSHGNVILCVEDDGPGIPAVDQNKIFELFYTTENHSSADDRRGLGLGLALCKTIVQAHNGKIREYNHKPHGAVFEMVFPEMEVHYEPSATNTGC